MSWYKPQGWLDVDINTGMHRTLFLPKRRSDSFFHIKIPKKLCHLFVLIGNKSWQFFPLFYFTGFEFTCVVHRVCNVTDPFMYLLSSSAPQKQRKLSSKFFVHCCISIHQEGHSKASSEDKRFLLLSKLLMVCVPKSKLGYSGCSVWGPCILGVAATRRSKG